MIFYRKLLRRLNDGFESPNEVVEAAHVLFKEKRSNSITSAELAALVSALQNAISNTSFAELLDHVLEYGVRLALHSSELMFEEIAKLFSLCDDVAMLEEIGFASNPVMKARFVEAVEARIRRQPGVAREAAKVNEEDWNRGAWWQTLATTL